MNPLVTIMIPTYNQAAYLAAAVQSALEQDYSNLEVVVVDDCSADETFAVIEEFLTNERLKYFRNETNLGKTANYRHALYEIAKGDWVLNLDGDDYLADKSYISFAMQQINRYHNVVLFTAGVKSIWQNGFRFQHIHRLVKEQVCLEGKNLFLNWQRYKIPHLTSLYHRQTACRIGFYDVDISSTDWESMLRLVLHGNVILSERISGVWRKHRNNLSQTMDFHQFAANITFITKPLEYAHKNGCDKNLLETWEKKMIETIVKSQFNEVWINVMRKRSFTGMIQLMQTVKKEKPEFVDNFFQLKNVARFFLIFLVNGTVKFKYIIQTGETS